MYREYKKRKIIIFSLIGILFLMAVGYSAFQTKLNISSTSNITSVWDVEITNVQTKEINGLAENVYDPTFSKLEANMEANFYEPGDYITYIVTVSNLGTLDATLDSIKLNMPQEDVINFKVEGATSKEKLKVGEHKDIEVTMEYTGNNPDNISSVEMDVNLDYVQDGNSTNFSDADSPVVDNLRINDIILTPTETSVKAEIDAENAIKYYFSIDNNEWYETTENIYNIYHLKPNTTYTMYVKAEGSNGDVVYSSKPFTTLDNTPPEINITVGDNVKGENGWYKGLSLNIEVTDNDKVKEVLYCNEQNCTPSESLSLENDKTTITFESKSYIQEVCIKATDMKENVSNKCSSEYQVDGTEPTISNMTITPRDNVMTVELEASDNESGLYKYYFSKDGGKTYIESDNPNYTFTSLDEGDYLVTAYVKDTAGNESEIQAKSTSIRYTSFCLKNGITDFGDCLITTETQNPNIDEAKTFIESKGTPDFSKTSPSIVYDEKYDTKLSYERIVTNSIYIGTGYTFNEETGNYTITDLKGYNLDSFNVNDGKDYYTVLRPDNQNNRPTIYKLVNMNKTEANTGEIVYDFTYYRYSQTPRSYDTSTVGMYADNDDDGKTYYYRGSVSSNYVKFAGYYWRIIRVNGDGTVRMIYDGTSPHANGESSSDRQTGLSRFNKFHNDNTYAGYMYSNPESFAETNSGTSSFSYIGLSSTAKYYFGTSYILDKESRGYKLSGDLVQGTIAPDKVGYYTCFSTNRDGVCQRLLYTTQYGSSTSMRVSGIGYGTTSKEQAQSNDTDSTIKTNLDNWYKNNLNGYTDKLSSDTIFCNNRTISNKTMVPYYNIGYGMNPTMYTGEKFRSWASQDVLGPDLSCPLNDSLSVKTTKGNGKLTYPVGIITADEINMAGGTNYSNNMLYYLYSGNSYWTMTPYSFDSWLMSYNMYVSTTGNIEIVSATNEYGVRPVINLDPDKITFTGNGTMQDPYVIS